MRRAKQLKEFVGSLRFRPPHTFMELAVAFV
jgi:hypothetical protein